MNRALFMVACVLFTGTAASTAGAFDKSALVWKKCAGCHAAENGKISRIEELRTTPEEWTVIVDRMYRLHGMPLEAGEMATLLKELSATQILSPEEAAQVAYLNLFNNPQTIETPNGPDEERLFATCVRCHSAGKIHSYRMTPSAWAKLRDFHLYIDPAIMYQMREMHWRDEADAVLQGLAENYPYQGAWTAPDANPEGEWLVLGVEPGKGNYRGRASLISTGHDEYVLEGSLSFADGTRETFSGEATLYGGYALRTRTRHNGSATMGAFSFVDGIIEGAHHHAAPDFRTASSTWYPVTKKSLAWRMTPGYLLTDEATTILVEGTELPKVKTSDIRISADVEVLQATTTSPETIELVLAYRGSEPATASVDIRGLDATAPPLKLQLAPRMDYLTVTPATGRARVNGGVNYPAEGVQFQAFAYSRGVDADDPLDDVLLGPVAAEFSLAEKETRPGDDDLAYLGAIQSNGSYIPVSDYNAIPARSYRGEGTGMVKVTAQYVRGTETYTAEGLLVVTVPDLIQRIR